MIRREVREALVFGLFAMIPGIAIQTLALTLSRTPRMTVTVTFRNTSIPDAVFTNATYTIVGTVLTIEGTNSDGIVGVWAYHWDDVFCVARV